MRSKFPVLAERLKKRYVRITGVFILFLAILIGRLFLIEVIDGASYARVTQNRSRSASSIAARRGEIMDRNNVLLASSTVEYNLILDPKVILDEQHNYLDITSMLVEKCLGISASEVREKAYGNSERSYVVLKRGLTYSDVGEFMEMYAADAETIKTFLGLPEEYSGRIEAEGVWLEDSSKRNYPYGSLACSVLGFTQQGVGQYGIEKYYNAELAGTDGKKYTYLNNDNVVESVYRTAQDGNRIQLTIDYNIQAIVEKHMMAMLEETGAKSVAVTIQDPNTGEFLAMADTGIFDPNDPRDLSVRYSAEKIRELHESDEETTKALTENWKNFCVAESFEPGSTYKAFTVAGALEEGCISQSDYFYCDGSVPIRDYTIHCANIDGHGHISLITAMAESCNMALMDIAEAQGVDIFTKYQSQFGFGSMTGVDLPNEMDCKTLLFSRENMTDINLATNSFGQRFNVTMVQMSSAFSSLVNGGTYYKPYVVRGIYNSRGELIQSVGKTVVSRPVSEETGDFIKESLRYVVTEGTGTDAAVGGYITAGKTGTAEKGVHGDLWIASFIGFAPFEHPQVVCYVVIDEPEAGGDGSSVYACELFSNIMAEVLPYINATPAMMDYDPTGVGSPENTPEQYEYTDDGEESDGEDDEEDAGDYTEEDGETYDDTAEDQGYDDWGYTDEYTDEYADDGWYEEEAYEDAGWYEEDAWYEEGAYADEWYDEGGYEAEDAGYYEEEW